VTCTRRRPRRRSGWSGPAAGGGPRSPRSTCPPRRAPGCGSRPRDLAGGIDILVNNASAIRFGPIGELSFADWSFTIRNELDIVFLVTRAAWPHLVAAGGGSIVNVASITASRGAFFMPQNAHGAAKGGVLALTYQLVVEGGPHGIRVNAVSPAMTETPQTAPLLHDPDGPAASIAPACRWAGGGSRRTSPRRSCSSARTRRPT
jgi:Dehydrogenases with different specificities (related to short-chain alcohol dehydrogenases)